MNGTRNGAPQIAEDNEKVHQMLTEAISQATEAVFTTMLAVEFNTQQVSREEGGPQPHEGILSFVGMAGPWVGTGSISLSAALACQLSSALLMSEYEFVNEEVLDAVAEITNMIIGNVKTYLEERLGGMGLSIPTVIFGRNFTTRSVGTNHWTVVRYMVGAEQFSVHMCLLPQSDSHRLRAWVGGLPEVGMPS